MPLTADQEELEHELRVRQMVNLEQMDTNIEKMRKDIRMESRKVALQTVGTLMAAFAAGVGASALYLRLGH